MSDTKNEGETLLELINDYIAKTGATKRWIAEALDLTHTLLSKPEKLRNTEKLKKTTAIKAKALFNYDFEKAAETNGEAAKQLADMQKRVGAAAESEKIKLMVNKIKQIKEDIDNIEGELAALLDILQE